MLGGSNDIINTEVLYNLASGAHVKEWWSSYQLLSFLRECAFSCTWVLDWGCPPISNAQGSLQSQPCPSSPAPSSPFHADPLLWFMFFYVPQARKGDFILANISKETNNYLWKENYFLFQKFIFASLNWCDFIFWLALCSILLSRNYSFGVAGVCWEKGTKSKRANPSGTYVEALSEATDTEMWMLEFYLLVSFRYWYNVSSRPEPLNQKLNSIPLHGTGCPAQWIDDLHGRAQWWDRLCIPVLPADCQTPVDPAPVRNRA